MPLRLLLKVSDGLQFGGHELLLLLSTAGPDYHEPGLRRQCASCGVGFRAVRQGDGCQVSRGGHGACGSSGSRGALPAGPAHGQQQLLGSLRWRRHGHERGRDGRRGAPRFSGRVVGHGGGGYVVGDAAQGLRFLTRRVRVPGRPPFAAGPGLPDARRISVRARPGGEYGHRRGPVQPGAARQGSPWPAESWRALAFSVPLRLPAQPAVHDGHCRAGHGNGRDATAERRPGPRSGGSCSGGGDAGGYCHHSEEESRRRGA